MIFIGNRFKKKHLLVSESYCRIAIVLFIYVSYTNKKKNMFIPTIYMYDVGNPDPGLGQAHKKCDGLNLDHNPPLLITGFPTRFFPPELLFYVTLI